MMMCEVLYLLSAASYTGTSPLISASASLGRTWMPIKTKSDTATQRNSSFNHRRDHLSQIQRDFIQPSKASYSYYKCTLQL